MKALVCELCGGNELTKEDDGFFHCVHCGTKYTVEAARKLMIDGVVQVKAADFNVKVGVLQKYDGESRDIVIPDNVVEISPYAFQGLPIESLDLGSSVKKIGAGAFADCGDLKTVSFGTNLKEVGVGAFKNCTSLKEVEFPDGIEVVHTKAFAGCTNLKRACFPTSFTQHFAALQAFGGCGNLSKVEGLPEDIKKQLWMDVGRCQHCGGEFEANGGFLKKYVCSLCGTKKDYY